MQGRRNRASNQTGSHNLSTTVTTTWNRKAIIAPVAILSGEESTQTEALSTRTITLTRSRNLSRRYSQANRAQKAWAIRCRSTPAWGVLSQIGQTQSFRGRRERTKTTRKWHPSLKASTTYLYRIRPLNEDHRFLALCLYNNAKYKFYKPYNYWCEFDLWRC